MEILPQNVPSVAQVAANGAQHPNTAAKSARANGAHQINGLTTPADLAARWHLKPQQNGKWSGPHPTDKGRASKDGFTLCPEGNAFTNRGETFKSEEVAELAGIEPGQYSPIAEYRARNGSPATLPGAAKVPQIAQKAPANGISAAKAGGAKPDRGAPVESIAFDYTDEMGGVLFRVNRKKFADGSKDFPTCRPDGRGGWIYKLENVRRVLWRLPDVLTAQTVFLCEGEKAASALNLAFEQAGIFGKNVATTNPQGAGKWRDEFCEPLERAAVCVLPDNDEPGAKHGAAICLSIQASGRAASLKCLELPGLPAKGDVCDWLDSGGSVAQLLELLELAPEWEPAPALLELATEAQAPSKLIRIGDLHKRPAPKWLVHRFLVANTTSLFTADSGSYKSFIALHIGYCVAHCLPFFGRGVQCGPVVYVAGEGGGGLRARSIAWDTYHGRQSPENLFVWESAVQVAQPGEVAAFLLELETEGVRPALIIFDTLNRCAEGLEENSARDMGLFCAGLERIKRATGAHVCVVHHNNAGGKSRGSTALPGAFDTRFSAERDADGLGNIVTLRCQKQKDGAPEFEPFALETRSVEIGEVDEYGEAITSLVLEPSETIGEPRAKAKKPKPENSEKEERVRRSMMEVLERDFPKGAGAQAWQLKCAELDICQKTAFYDRRNELRDAGQIIQVGNVWIPFKDPSSPSSPSSQANLTDLADLSGSQVRKFASPVGTRTGEPGELDRQPGGEDEEDEAAGVDI